MLNPDQTINNFDKYLNIFLPLITALIGGIFTLIVLNLSHSRQKKQRLYEEQLKVYGEVYKKLVQIKNEIEVIHLVLKKCFEDAKENKIEITYLSNVYVNAYSDLKKKYIDLFEIFYSSYLFEEELLNKISFLYNEMAKMMVVYPQDTTKPELIESFIKLFDETLNSFREIIGISKNPKATIPRPEKNFNEEFTKRKIELTESQEKSALATKV